MPIFLLKNCLAAGRLGTQTPAFDTRELYQSAQHAIQLMQFSGKKFYL